MLCIGREPEKKRSAQCTLKHKHSDKYTHPHSHKHSSNISSHHRNKQLLVMNKKKSTIWDKDMKPSPTSSLFPLITPSTVPLARKEWEKKERDVRKDTKKGNADKGESENTRQKKRKKKEIKYAFDTWKMHRVMLCSNRVHPLDCKRPKGHVTDGLFLPYKGIHPTFWLHRSMELDLLTQIFSLLKKEQTSYC